MKQSRSRPFSLKPFSFLFSMLLASGTTFADAPRSGESLLGEVNQRIKNINTIELHQMLEKNPQLILVDVRTPGEIERLGGSIDGQRSYNIPAGWVEFRIADRAPDTETPIVVYCGINQRSPLVADRLQQLGYNNVYNFADGFFVWRDEGLPVDIPDQAPNSQLYRLPEQVSENVWSAIGDLAPGTYPNGGHNNNLSFVITSEGVLVFNAGENNLLARALHEEIKKLTDQPVKYVVWENGQGHAIGGSGYWKEQGATIIAHDDAFEKVKKQGAAIIERIHNVQREKAIGTRLVMPDETFSDRRVIVMGGERIELHHFGSAHSPGDISAWLPAQKLVIAGDIAFNQRMLPIFENTDTAAWVETWDAFAALNAEKVIPGHGDPTDMQTVTEYTMGYLKNLRGQVGALLEDGGSLADVSRVVDQSAFAHMKTFEELSALNASRLFRQMEFE